jgi:hypothetical protein
VNPDKEHETELQKLRRFAAMRHARSKAVNAFGDRTYEDVWDNITQEELEYYAKKQAEKSPAQIFLEDKEEWWFHDSNYYMRDVEEYDGVGCYNGICVPGCQYYIEAIDEEERRKLNRQIQQPIFDEYNIGRT